jgi:ABC-type branched-subunit amino acid transport system ATPase component
MAENAILAEELIYRYGQLLVVDHVSFHVAQGEILGFLGPNGAGKTTTVKMLTGQPRPQQAQISVCFERIGGRLDGPGSGSRQKDQAAGGIARNGAQLRSGQRGGGGGGGLSCIRAGRK